MKRLSYYAFIFCLGTDISGSVNVGLIEYKRMGRGVLYISANGWGRNSGGH